MIENKQILSKFYENNLLESNIFLSFREGIIILALAFLAGLIVRYLYINYANSFSSKASYANSLLMVTLCVAGLIAVVKSSLALSLGLVGALSVVRFRTAVKEPYTLSFVLLSVCLGISIGAGQYLFAFLITVMGTLISLFTNKKSTEGNQNLKQTDIDTLSITAKNEKYLFDALSLASSYVKTYSVKTISTSSDQFCMATVGVNVGSHEILRELIEKITKSDGIINVNFYNSPL